jgi:hypothetical protein
MKKAEHRLCAGSRNQLTQGLCTLGVEEHETVLARNSEAAPMRAVCHNDTKLPRFPRFPLDFVRVAKNHAVLLKRHCAVVALQLQSEPRLP